MRFLFFFFLLLMINNQVAKYFSCINRFFIRFCKMFIFLKTLPDDKAVFTLNVGWIDPRLTSTRKSADVN